MNSNVVSTLSGCTVAKHHKLGILVREDGAVLHNGQWTYGNDDGHGYKRIVIHGHGYYIHRLVAECFLPNPYKKPTVDHIDRNRGNNHKSNLQWASYKEQSNNTKRNKPLSERLLNDKISFERWFHW